MVVGRLLSQSRYRICSLDLFKFFLNQAVCVIWVCAAYVEIVHMMNFVLRCLNDSMRQEGIGLFYQWTHGSSTSDYCRRPLIYSSLFGRDVKIL